MTSIKAALAIPTVTNKPVQATPLDFGNPAQPAQPTANATPIEQPMQSMLTETLTLTTDIGDWQGQQLAPDAPELAIALQASLQHLQEALNMGDVSTALYDTKAFIDANPATKDLLMPSDINLFVKSLQASHSIVIAKKVTRKTAKTATNSAAEKLASELGDLGDFTL